VNLFGAGVTLASDAKVYFEADIEQSFRTLGAGVTKTHHHSES
jgi:hypothetical protein